MPEGRVRIRIRRGELVQAFVKTADGIKRYVVYTNNDHWTLGKCIGENRTLRASVPSCENSPTPASERPSDYRVAFPNNPFAVQGGITCGVEDCCMMLKSFTAEQCLDALVYSNPGKVVKKALEVRLRKIAKGKAAK